MSSPSGGNAFAAERTIQAQSGGKMRVLSNDIVATFRALETQSVTLSAGFAGDAAAGATVGREAMINDGINQAGFLGRQGDAWVAAANNQGAIDEESLQNLKNAVPGTAP